MRFFMNVCTCTTCGYLCQCCTYLFLCTTYHVPRTCTCTTYHVPRTTCPYTMFGTVSKWPQNDYMYIIHTCTHTYMYCTYITGTCILYIKKEALLYHFIIYITFAVYMYVQVVHLNFSFRPHDLFIGNYSAKSTFKIWSKIIPPRAIDIFRVIRV